MDLIRFDLTESELQTGEIVLCLGLEMKEKPCLLCWGETQQSLAHAEIRTELKIESGVPAVISPRQQRSFLFETGLFQAD